MQRFNKQFKKHVPLSPLVFRVALIILAVGALFFGIRAIVNHVGVIELRAEHAKELLRSKQSLIKEIDSLREAVNSYDTKRAEFRLLQEENNRLKNEFGRIAPAKGVLATVLTLPNQSFYDTIVVDAGTREGITDGQIVYAFDDVAIGTVSAVTDRSSTVLLFSAPGRETAGRAEGSDVAITLIGRGNGDFEVRMPRDVHFSIGDIISYQSTHAAYLAQIEKIITDPRDPFQRLLAKVPFNLTTLKWVIVR